MASNHYDVNHEVEIKIKVKIKTLHNYRDLDEEGKKKAIDSVVGDLPSIVVHSLNNHNGFVSYGDHLGTKILQITTHWKLKKYKIKKIC